MERWDDVDLNSIIERLVEVRNSRPGKEVKLLEKEIQWLCINARQIFIDQPILLELEAPLKVRLLETHGLALRLLRSEVLSNRANGRRTIFSLETMSIEGNSRLRPSVSCLPIRSNTRRISFSCAVIMNARLPTVSTVSLMNASEGTISSCGKFSPTVSTACPLLQSSMRRSSPCTAASARISLPWSRSAESCALPGANGCRFLTVACSATCCGLIRTRTSQDGARTTAAFPLPSAPMLSHASSRSMTSISSVVATKSWKTDMSSSPSASSSPCSVPRTTRESLIMQAQ